MPTLLLPLAVNSVFGPRVSAFGIQVAACGRRSLAFRRLAANCWPSAWGCCPPASGIRPLAVHLLNLFSALCLGLRLLGLGPSFCSCLPPPAPGAPPGAAAVNSGANAKVQYMLFVLPFAHACGCQYNSGAHRITSHRPQGRRHAASKRSCHN